MSNNLGSPDFSFIRSPSERAQAQRSYEVGIELADGLYAVGVALQRTIESIAAGLRRRPQPLNDW